MSLLLLLCEHVLSVDSRMRHGGEKTNTRRRAQQQTDGKRFGLHIGKAAGSQLVANVVHVARVMDEGKEFDGVVRWAAREALWLLAEQEGGEEERRGNTRTSTRNPGDVKNSGIKSSAT